MAVGGPSFIWWPGNHINLFTDDEVLGMIWTAKVPTTNGSRYLQQLCKHWSHKFETRFDADRGSIAFPMGPIDLAATADMLTVSIDPDADADVAQFKQVVADHLDRFAFREAPLRFDWTAA